MITVPITPYIEIACGHCNAQLTFTGDGYECPRCKLFFDGDESEGRFIEPDEAACGRVKPSVQMTRDDETFTVDYRPCDLPGSHLSDHHFEGHRRSS